eukprot:SAG11_NODE_9057_length_948_cov_1.330978_1_plen_115_part_00
MSTMVGVLVSQLFLAVVINLRATATALTVASITPDAAPIGTSNPLKVIILAGQVGQEQSQPSQDSTRFAHCVILRHADASVQSNMEGQAEVTSAPPVLRGAPRPHPARVPLRLW